MPNPLTTSVYTWENERQFKQLCTAKKALKIEMIFAVRSVDIIESVLSQHIGDWEAVLTRNGYDLKALAALLAVKPREIKLLLQGQLYPVEPPRLL